MGIRPVHTVKWDSPVCRKGTSRSTLPVLALTLGAVVWAQGQSRPDWRKVGSSAVELMLAAPATGPVDRVWFAADGTLYARTHLGKVYQTSDFGNWTPAVQPPDPPPVMDTPVPRQPEPGIRVVSLAGSSAPIYGLGRQLFRSTDGGR